MAMVEGRVRVFVLCGDYWHPSETIRSGLRPLNGSSDFIFDFLEDAGDWSEEGMMKYELVILTKSNHTSSQDQTPWMTPEVQAGFLRYVEAGHGLLIIHSGTAGYREQSVLRGITGGAFMSHPEPCSITTHLTPGNSLNIDLPSFSIFDEHYMMDLDDKKAEVFLMTSSEHGNQPAGWTRRQGAGRVCVLTPGHHLEVWLHSSYQELIHKSLIWCKKHS